MNNTTLVIMMGSSRGGRHAKLTQKKYFLNHLDADLAICFGDVDETENSIIKLAKYNWNFKDYENWREYFEKNFSENIFENLEKGKDNYLMGGIDSYSGSGAIIFAIRDILLNNYLEIIQSYDQVILTRSDYIYLDYHPKLKKDKIWAVNGEDYFGITDRHYIFPGHKAEKILGICKYLDIKDIHREWPEIKNPETILYSYFQHIGVLDDIGRFQRVQMVVKESRDSTTTREGVKLFLFKDLYAKKIGEFEESIKNLKFSSQFTSVNIRLKINYFLFQIRKMINNLTNKLLKRRIFTQ